MHDHQIRLSYVVLFVAGLGLLFSVPFLPLENMAPWLAFNTLFLIGCVLLIFKR